jgi:hypothetical protein
MSSQDGWLADGPGPRTRGGDSSGSGPDEWLTGTGGWGTIPPGVATVAALLMGPDGAFITGSDFLMDGGVTAF